MEDAPDTGSLFRVTGAIGGAKNELVARGGSGGALALSRAPVGGSASPAPAPLPQPAPSPAPAALPPPALPPPPFRADTPHRPNSAHIPAIDGHAATQIPARPIGAAGPDTPERPASNNNKLQPGARAAADSPTPAPPAPPAPSPLFPPQGAYQALPDHRHTNHETRTEPSKPPTPAPPAAPLDLHSPHAQQPRAQLAGPAPHPVLPAHPAHASLPGRAAHPHPGLPGHDAAPRPPPTSVHAAGTVPTSYPSRINGVPQNATQPTAVSAPSSLPSQTLSGRPISPQVPTCRSYPSPMIGSSHINSSISSNFHGHSISYQSQSSIQKHSVQAAYSNRPQHLTSFSVSNHLSNHTPSVPANQTPLHYSHTLNPVNSHSALSHSNHLPTSIPNTLTTSAPSHHLGPSLSSTASSTMSSYVPSQKHMGLSLPHHHNHMLPPVSVQSMSNHMEASPTSSLPSVVGTPTSSSGSIGLPPAGLELRQPAGSEPAVTALSARTESPATSNGYPPPAAYTSPSYPPLYAPYAATLQHSPYLPPAAASPRNSTDTRLSLSSSPLVAPKTPKGVRSLTPITSGAPTVPAISHTQHSYSPRGHSPNRERESFSSISSLSRSTSASVVAAPVSSAGAVMPAPLVPTITAPLAPLGPPLPTPLSNPLSAPLAPLTAPLAAPTPTPAAPAAPHLTHTLAPVPTIPSISSSAKPPAHWGVTRPPGVERAGFAPVPPLFGAPLAPPNPNPFSAESLFQTSPGADLLRRELDSRFLAAAGAVGVRTEMHHHQHQHTHVHQHPPAHPPTHHPLLVPHAPHAPIFKDVSKMSSLYRSGLGLGYPYSTSLLHPSSPYVPPTPLTTYAAPKKTGKWNAMHVRIAWEIYNHQQKDKSSGGGTGIIDKDKLRGFPATAPSAAPPPTAYRSPYDLPPAPYLPHHPHIGVSPFVRYGAGAFQSGPGTFGLSAYGRDLALSSSLHGMHHSAPLASAASDAWRVRAQPPADVRREHEERERARREREERERRERDERERRKARELRERDLERARARSPLRNGGPEPPKEERKEPPRPPPSLPAYAPPPPWDPYRAAFDPLHHMRFAPLVEAAIRAEEDRAKMLSAYAHHHQLKSSQLLHRGLPPLGAHPHAHAHPHAPLPPLGAHPHAHPHAPLAPLAPPLAPLAPLDLLKKEEPR